MIKLPVPYFSQLNNSTQHFGTGSRQCNLTSTAMALDYILKGDLSVRSRLNGYDEPESYYGSKLVKYGDTTSNDANTQCLKEEFGVESEWRYDLTRQDVVTQLQKNFPVPAGVAFGAGGSGHIICFVGFTQDGLLVHDPYGRRHSASNSYDIGVGGEYDSYSWDLLDQVFWDQGSNTGWGRIFTGKQNAG